MAVDVIGQLEAFALRRRLQRAQVYHAQPRPRAFRAQAASPGRRRFQPHQATALAAGDLQRRGPHRRGRAERHRLAVDLQQHLAQGRIGAEQLEVETHRGLLAARAEIGVAHLRGALEVIEHVLRYAERDLVAVGTPAPLAPAHVHVGQQVLLEELVHQPAGREELAEIVLRHLLGGAAHQRVAAGDGLAAELGGAGRPQRVQAFALAAHGQAGAAAVDILEHLAQRRGLAVAFPFQLGQRIAGRRRHAGPLGRCRRVEIGGHVTQHGKQAVQRRGRTGHHAVQVVEVHVDRYLLGGGRGAVAVGHTEHRFQLFLVAVALVLERGKHRRFRLLGGAGGQRGLAGGRHQHLAQRRIDARQHGRHARALVQGGERHDAQIGQEAVPFRNVVVVVQLQQRGPDLFIAGLARHGFLAVQHPVVAAHVVHGLPAQLQELGVAGHREHARHAARERFAAAPHQHLGRVASAGGRGAELGQLGMGQRAFQPVVQALLERHAGQCQARVRHQLRIELLRQLETGISFHQRGHVAHQRLALGRAGVGHVAQPVQFHPTGDGGGVVVAGVAQHQVKA